ncbi:MAG: iron-containing redox enzyme family protein [Egibacteraceae bacterium]
MRVKSSDSDLKQLFIYNRSLRDLDTYSKILEIERDWIVRLANATEASAPTFESRAQLLDALHDLLEREEHAPSESVEFFAKQSTREQFKVIIGEFAVDGLTEAQSFFPIIARLPIKSQMAVMRVLIDEFGCGNVDQAHSQLYRNLLTELEMPLDIESYLDGLNDESYAFLNVFYWLSERAPQVEYFLGALAYLEASIPFAFSCYANACARLGIIGSRYYTEHMHIDGFHMKELQIAIRELEAAGELDYKKVWVGTQLASSIIAEAFEAAVAKARKVA